MDETAVFKYISDLIQSGELSGSCTAKEYVPESFQQQQRHAVDEYFALYGIIEFQKLTSEFGVGDPRRCGILILNRFLGSSLILFEYHFLMQFN